MRFVEDISRFYGTGEKNKAGQTLEESLLFRFQRQEERTSGL